MFRAVFPVTSQTTIFPVTGVLNTEVLISPSTEQEGKKLQRQKILMFIYPIYYHNWGNISTIYMHNKTDIK
jgi:hypothetical protein